MKTYPEDLLGDEHEQESPFEPRLVGSMPKQPVQMSYVEDVI